MGRREISRTLIAIVLHVACSGERARESCEDCGGRIHPRGILDERSDNFHGKELARRDWDFALCASCHGDDFAGGRAGVGCLDCHDDGPTACSTCHRGALETGAHADHAVADVACGACHVVPTSWDDPGHILGDVSPGADVTFGATAGLGDVRQGPPSYADGTCANVYCHGDTIAAGGIATRPRWEAQPSSGCASCHGVPPPSHAQDACAACHPATSAHVDGVVQIGTTDGCDGCHGSGGSSAPPRALDGATSTTSLGVGAHRAHLAAPSGLRGPIPCATCHVVPTTVTSAGHIDSPLPAEVDAGLGWNRTDGTCATAWCHGPARPRWTETGGAACGTCHGVPPATPAHAPDLPLSSCGGCHPYPTVPAASSGHIDGDVDVL